MNNKKEDSNFILVIEDSDTKWREIEILLHSIDDIEISFERAKTMQEANRLVSSQTWSLILLDISMNIKSSSSGPAAGGHDFTGGLKIAERMYYLGQDAPIIIVTAFDAFPAKVEGRGEVLGLDEVVKSASNTLGELLVGSVRYGESGWSKKLEILVREVLQG